MDVQPYHLDASGKEPRYYQVEAINRTIEAVANGQKRVLHATVTGTSQAQYGGGFRACLPQIHHRLAEYRWVN